MEAQPLSLFYGPATHLAVHCPSQVAPRTLMRWGLTGTPQNDSAHAMHSNYPKPAPPPKFTQIVSCTHLQLMAITADFLTSHCCLHANCQLPVLRAALQLSEPEYSSLGETPPPSQHVHQWPLLCSAFACPNRCPDLLCCRHGLTDSARGRGQPGRSQSLLRAAFARAIECRYTRACPLFLFCIVVALTRRHV